MVLIRDWHDISSCLFNVARAGHFDEAATSRSTKKKGGFRIKLDSLSTSKQSIERFLDSDRGKYELSDTRLSAGEATGSLVKPDSTRKSSKLRSQLRALLA